jgi:signal transduction histidine kinase
MLDNHDRSAKVLSLAVHEFRTPVSVVSGYLRMLLRHFGSSLTDQQRTLVEQADKSCDSIASLIKELGELAQLESGRTAMRRERGPLAPLLIDLAKDAHEGEERGVTFGVRPCDADVLVVGDSTGLATALATLITAVLRERADSVSMLAACRILDTSEGRVVRIAIAEAAIVDTVLAGEEHEAFDEYRGGLGFRLLLASRIVGAHGGRVSSPVSARGCLAILVSLPVAPGSVSIE